MIKNGTRPAEPGPATTQVIVVRSADSLDDPPRQAES